MPKKTSSSSELIWKKLQNLLTRRSYSETELIQKLKNFDTTEVKNAIKKAQQNKWLEPPEEMTQKIVATCHRKKKGWLYIKQSLKKKGLPPPSKDPTIEKEKALYWLSKKSPSKNLQKKEKEQLYRFLSYRGFESSDITSALKDFRKS